MSAEKATTVLNLFHQYYDELYAFLTARLRCREEAADVIQDAYVRMLSLQHLEEIRQPRAFLYKTAVNLMVDAFRKQQIRSERGTDLEAVEELRSQEPDQESVVESRERLAHLHGAIAELPPKCRHVFLLHKFQNLSHAEIAAGLGISKNMVEKHVIKAMAHCRKRLDEADQR